MVRIYILSDMIIILFNVIRECSCYWGERSNETTEFLYNCQWCIRFNCLARIFAIVDADMAIFLSVPVSARDSQSRLHVGHFVWYVFKNTHDKWKSVNT